MSADGLALSLPRGNVSLHLKQTGSAMGDVRVTTAPIDPAIPGVAIRDKGTITVVLRDDLDPWLAESVTALLINGFNEPVQQRLTG